MTHWSEPPATGGTLTEESDPRPYSVDPGRHLNEVKTALAQSREELRLALASAEIGFWQYDLETREVMGSDVFRNELGLARDTLLTIEKLQERCHPQDVRRVRHAIERAVTSHSDYDTACRIIRTDGSTGHLALKGCAIYADGKPIRLLSTTRRISDADRAARDVAAAQRRRKFLLDLRDDIRGLEDSAAIIDIATRDLGIFLAADRVGYGAARSGETVNREWSNRSSEQADLAYALEAAGSTILSELGQGRTIIMTDAASDPRLEPDARIHYAARRARSAILVPLIKSGRLTASLYVSANRPHAFSADDATLAEEVAERIWDAAERALAEGELRESQARLRIVAETLPALVWIVTPDLELVYANARWSRYAGLPENESLGLSWMQAVHPDDLARVMEDFKAVLRNQSAYSTEARYRNRDGAYRWHMIRAEPIHDARGMFRGWSGTSVDIHDLKRTEEALRKNEAQLRLALQAAHMGVWNWDRTTDVLELAEGASELFGLDPTRKITWSQLQQRLNPADATRMTMAIEQALETGESYNIEYRITRENGDGPIWLATQGQTSYSPNGVAIGMTGVVQDITDRKLAEERQNLLIRELHHRVKNTLATVQAIVGSTARTTSSIDEFYQGFVGRIVSLARTHNLLTEDIWQKASLDQLVQTELGPYDDDDRNRITVDGPPVELPSEAAVPVGMAIHELTTNAAKHGALSTFGGQVDVRWRLDEIAGKSVLHFSWIERGGPRVIEPRRQGFGSRLLRRVLTTQLQADVHMDFAQSGLQFTMTMPIPGKPPLFNPDH
ncbi:PAS domain-containing protein [Microvirga flavescens]|uniref:PAS domain-containing protein n=1 Tax=Microvirga flavescens TaxID=2249811 RepID=UPI000DD681D5|nr:PAS domain-containing protein [Microvirga flavescens]